MSDPQPRREPTAVARDVVTELAHQHPDEFADFWRKTYYGYITDNGNHILDVHDLVIKDPVALESALNQIPGVVTVGLFAQRPADVLLIGSDAGVQQI